MRKLDSRLYSSAELARVVGSRIVAFRRERGWSRRFLASLLAIHESWLESYERGLTLPPVYTIYQLAGAFEISVAALMDELPKEAPVTDRRLLSALRRLDPISPGDRHAILDFLEALLRGIERLRKP